MVIYATAQEIYFVSLFAWLPLMSVSATIKYLLNSMSDKVNALQRKYKLFVKFNTADKPFSLISYLNSVHRSIVCSWPIFL